MSETESGAEPQTPVVETEATVTETPEVSEGASTSTDDLGAQVPSGRLRETRVERDKAIEANKALQARLEALEAKLAPKEEPKAKGPLPEPPEGLSQRETIDWYVQEGATRAIEGKLGMGLDAVVTLLQSSRNATQKATEQQWQEACKSHKLDPSDVMVQATVMGLVQGSKMDLDDALAQTAKRFGPTSPNGKKDVATVPDGTQSGVMTQSDRQPKTREEAVTMAQAGQRAKQLSTLEILGAKRK